MEDLRRSWHKNDYICEIVYLYHLKFYQFLILLGGYKGSLMKLGGLVDVELVWETGLPQEVLLQVSWHTHRWECSQKGFEISEV